MKRRDFIIQSTAGTAWLGLSSFQIFSPPLSGEEPSCHQSARKIPLAYEVDVLVVGGSSAGVAAALHASENGARTFLVAQEPYLGEDICSTYRYWREDWDFLSPLEVKLFGKGLPTPMHIKHSLDQALIERDIPFLYSSFATDVILDEDRKLAGIVISNRSGRQAILARSIIDATPRALVARRAGVRFPDYPSGRQHFKFTVVGNDIRQAPGLTARVQEEEIVLQKKTNEGEQVAGGETRYRAIEYSMELDMKDGSYAAFAMAEQKARDLSWDPKQVDSSDCLFQVPPDRMMGRRQWKQEELDAEKISLEVFRPSQVDHLYVLSGSADLSDAAAEKLLEPGHSIRIGERIGRKAAEASRNRPPLIEPEVSASAASEAAAAGVVSEQLEGIRPLFNLGEIDAEATRLPVLGSWDVVVVGAGTAGAPAALGASRKGSKTLVLDYLHGMGGTGTLGMIGRYYHGYRKGFTKEVDLGVKAIGGDNPRKKKSLEEWVFDWKTEWFRSEIRKAGGEIWFGVLACGAYVEKGRVRGVVVSTPGGRAVVLGHTIIDSSGSADIAIAAGAAYEYTDGETLAVQGAGLPYKDPDDFYNNTDWTFINDTDILDVWRTFVTGREKFKDHFDLGKMVQTRERRRIQGDYSISVLDVYNGRTYPDTISIHFSSFDTHGFTIDPYFALKPPAHSGVDVMAYVPLRALLPKGLDGIIVTGLGASAHRDAMPVIRMQPCLQNQGYAAGIGAAMVARNKQLIRDLDIRQLQNELVQIGSITKEVLSHRDNSELSPEEIRKAAEGINPELDDLELVLWNREKGLDLLSEGFKNAADKEERLLYARILGMYGRGEGYAILLEAVEATEEWDEGWDYRGMGQFGRSMSYLDSLIIALGNCKRAEALPALAGKAKKLKTASHFSHFRALALAFESMGDQKAAPLLYDLLQMEGMCGHDLQDIRKALARLPEGTTDTSLRNSALKEIVLGRSLYRCGDHQSLGRKILENYSRDLRGHFYRHASGVLRHT